MRNSKSFIHINNRSTKEYYEGDFALYYNNYSCFTKYGWSRAKGKINLSVNVYEFTDTLIRSSIEHQLIDSKLHEGCSFCLINFGNEEDREKDIRSFEFDTIP